MRSPLVVGHSSFIDLPSVQLFVDRARAVRPEFEVTERNAAAVAALCVRLEGIPLALELAAARVSLFTPEQILAQLSGPAYTSPLLVSQRRDAPPRHRSLGAAIQWSVDALSAELRRYFARLSVFRGGWTIEAAAAVCAEVPADNGRGMGWDGAAAIDGLQQLRDGSLILVEELPSPSSDSSLVIHPASLRFRMLETVREYAAELLSPEERSALRRRHAEFYTALAETAFPLLHGPDQALWFDRLEWEHDNFRAALSWCQSEPAAHVLGLKLAGLLNFFWTVRGHVVEGRRWLATFLAITDGSTPTPERAGALYGAARLASAQGDLDAACDLYGRSLPIWRALEDWISIARTLCQWGHVSERMGNRVAARPLYRQSLAICRELNDRGLLAHLLTRLGEDAKLQEEDERSRVLYEESLALYRELENARGIAMVLGQMADLALLRGEDERAVGLLNEHLELSRQLGDRQNTAEALGALGRLARLHGDRVAARSHLSEALSLLHGLGPQPAMAELLFCLAAVTGPGDVIGSVQDLLAEGATILREGADPQALASCLELMAEIRIAGNGASGLTAPDAIRAARLLAAAEATRVAVDATRAWHSQRRHREALLDAVVAVLGLDVFAAAWAKGRAMSRDAALNELQSALP